MRLSLKYPFSLDLEDGTLADKRKRRTEIRIKRRKRAKRKLEAGFKKVITHSGGRRKVKFVKPKE